MIEPAIEIEGADEIRRAFKTAGGATKDLSRAHRSVAKIVERAARDNAASGTRQQARAASSLLGKGSARGAAIAIRNTSKVPFGLGAFMGSLRWRRFPPWVGNDWDLVDGVGPYAVAPAIRDHRGEIIDTFRDEVGAVMADVGLNMDLT